MNFINRLQNENAELRAAQEAALAEIIRLRGILCGPKFTGFEADGSRKDWMATGDIDRILVGIGDTLVVR